MVEQQWTSERVERRISFCDGLEAGIPACDAALEAFAATACRAVLGGPATVAALAVAGRASGQQRLPV